MHADYDDCETRRQLSSRINDPKLLAQILAGKLDSKQSRQGFLFLSLFAPRLFTF